jgi:hypothetical protein
MTNANGNGASENGGNGRVKKLICATKIKVAGENEHCRRPPRWRVGKLRTPLCNLCFDRWVETHWEEFEPDTIERLSDNERDFEYVANREREPLCQIPKPIQSNERRA